MKFFNSALYQRVTNISFAFILAVSTLTAMGPFLFSEKASAVDTATYSPVGLSGWTTDRTFPSGGVNEVLFAGRSALELSIENEAASTAGSFYRTEGVKKAIPEVDSIKADLYIDGDWVENDTDVRAGLWSVGRNSADAISSYPIVEFTNTSDFTGLRIWNSYAPGGWVETAADYELNAWNSFELTISATDDTRTDVYVNGELVGQSQHNPTAYFREIILNSYNYGTTASDDYSVRWSNIEAGVYAPNTPPEVVFNAPTPADGGQVNGLVEMSATATDDYGMGAYYLRFWKDAFEVAGGGTLLQNCMSVPGAFLLGTSETADCSYDVSSLAHGTTVVVSAQFMDGNQAMTKIQRTLAVDKELPNAYFQVQPPSVVSGDFHTRLRVDNETGMINKSIYFNTVDAENLCRNVNSTHRNLDATCDASALPEGTHELVGVAVDEAGNRTEVTSNSFIVDKTIPTITVKDNSIGGDGVYSKVSFKLFDANKVDRLTLNGVEKNLSDNKYSDFNNVEPGKFGAVEGDNTLVVYDVAGNSATLTFALDTTDPLVEIDTVASTINGVTTFSGTASDDGSGLLNEEIRLVFRPIIGGVLQSPEKVYRVDVVGGNWTIDIDTAADLTDGQLYRVVARANDSVGGTYQTSNTAADRAETTVDNTAPVVTINALEPVIIGDNAVFTGTMDDPTAVLTFTLDGIEYPTTNDGTTWQAIVPTSGFDAGDYVAVISAEDAVGNASAADTSTQTTLTVEEPAPVPEEEIEGTDTTPETTPLTTGGTPQIAPQAVLGDTTDNDDGTTNQDEDDAEVEGATTEGTFAQADTDTTDGTFLGLAWYWWLLIVGGLAALIGWLIAAARRRSEES